MFFSAKKTVVTFTGRIIQLKDSEINLFLPNVKGESFEQIKLYNILKNEYKNQTRQPDESPLSGCDKQKLSKISFADSRRTERKTSALCF